MFDDFIVLHFCNRRAPETQHKVPYTMKADVFSLGKMCVEMWLGGFHVGQPGRIMLPPLLHAFVRRCTAEVNRRPSSVELMVRYLS